MTSPCCNAPVIYTPFRVDNDYGIFVAICHSLNKYGIMDCKKPLGVHSEIGNKIGKQEADDIMALAKEGFVGGVRNENGRIVQAYANSRPTKALALPKDFTEPKEPEQPPF